MVQSLSRKAFVTNRSRVVFHDRIIKIHQEKGVTDELPVSYVTRKTMALNTEPRNDCEFQFVLS